MTDPEYADVTYIEPLTVEALEKIILKERPDALLPTLGGQTALNLAMDLSELGILEKYGVEMIGAEHSPGFETTTGSLAQALSTAGGIALGRRLKGETGRTFVFMSDGEFQEGQTWEAIQALAFYGLDSVRVVVDVNRAQCDGPMDSVMNIEPLATKIKAFGASADSVDGHNIAALTHALERPTGRPHFVLAYTDPVRGVPLMNERRPVLHYLRFTGHDERAKYEEFYEALVSTESVSSSGGQA